MMCRIDHYLLGFFTDMPPRRARFFKLIAFTLIWVFFTIRLGNVSHETFVAPIQQYIAKIAYVADGNTQAPVFPFKSKRTLLETFELRPQLELSPQPLLVGGYSAQRPLTSPPEVYLEPFIPPA